MPTTAMFRNVEPFRSDQLAPPQRNITIYQVQKYETGISLLMVLAISLGTVRPFLQRHLLPLAAEKDFSR